MLFPQSDLAVDVIDDTRPSEPFLEGVEAIRTMEDAPHRKLMGGITYYCCCVNCLGGKTVYPWQPCDPGIPKLLGTCNPLTCQSHRLCWNH